MIYKISNKGKTKVQCQLVGGGAVNILPGKITEVDSSKTFQREVDRLNRIPGVRVSALDPKAEAEAKKKAEEDAKKAAEEKAKADAEAKKAAEEAKKKGGNK